MDIVRFLRRNEVVDDYAQIVLLLHSVKDGVIRPYAEAFTDANIPVRSGSQTDDGQRLDPGHFRSRRREGVHKGKLPIMTMHASKGLEWPVVIVATAEPAAHHDDLDARPEALQPPAQPGATRPCRRQRPPSAVLRGLHPSSKLARVDG